MDDFNEVVEQYTPLIYHIIKKLNIYKQTDEYFQTGLIGLWEAYLKFDPNKGKFLSYAYKTIFGKMLYQMKKENQGIEHEVVKPVEFWAGIIDDQDHMMIEMILPTKFIPLLTPKQVAWLVEYIYKGKTIMEIAKEYQVPPSTVKSWKRTTLKKLKDYYIHHPEEFDI